MAVLNTRSSPNLSAKVAASRNTPPRRFPTSCPKNKHSGCLRINSSMACKAASTITTFSPPAGMRSPCSSVMEHGANTCVNAELASGSGEATARSNSANTKSFSSASIAFNCSSETPICNKRLRNFGPGSFTPCLAKSSSVRYHSFRTPLV